MDNNQPTAAAPAQSQSHTGGNYFSSTRVTFIAMFATLAGVLYILNFSIPFAFPSFLEFKLSDIPILIGSFTLGPAAGAIITVVEILLKLVVKGTSTMFVGELSDLVTSCAFAVTAGLIYSKHRSFKGALVAMAIGTVTEVTVAILFNWLVLVPFYVEFFFGGNWAPLIGMMTPLFPSCTQETFYKFFIWASVLPSCRNTRNVAHLQTHFPPYKRRQSQNLRQAERRRKNRNQSEYRRDFRRRCRNTAFNAVRTFALLRVLTVYFRQTTNSNPLR